MRQHRAGVQNQRRAGTNEKEKGIEGEEGRSEDKKTAISELLGIIRDLALPVQQLGVVGRVRRGSQRL